MLCFRRRDLETRQRILKDSHCGSFAVICMVLLAAAQWSLFFSFESFDFKALLTLAVLPACTRACSGIAVQTLKPMQTSQYSGAVRSAASVVSLFVQLALFLVLPRARGKVGFAPIAAVAVYWICILRRKKAARRHERRYFRLFAYTCGACGHCGTASVWPHVNGLKQLNR